MADKRRGRCPSCLLLLTVLPTHDMASERIPQCRGAGRPAGGLAMTRPRPRPRHPHAERSIATGNGNGINVGMVAMCTRYRHVSWLSP